MTLLPNATVTILIDGLIYTAYNEQQRLFQAGIHTQAEEHHLVVEVKADGKQVFPTEELPWKSSHTTVMENAPYWLYVDSGSGVPSDFSASLHKPADLSDPQSFGHIFSFEQEYRRGLKLELDRLAIFNFPHGTCYAAERSVADLLQFDQGKDPHTAKLVRPLNVASLSGIDIASEKAQRWIVLLSKNKEVFRFPLQQGLHYEIKLMNIAILTDFTDSIQHHPEKHFLQFYELFELDKEEKKFLLEAYDPKDGTKASPLCLILSGSQVRGLGN